GQDRAALDIEEVVAELPGRAQLRAGVAAADLRPSGDPRLHEVPPGVVGEAALQLGADLGALRSRADQRHLATKHAPQLRQLVDVGPAQEPAEPRHAPVTCLTPLRTALLRARHHRPQLHDLELLAALADAPLP